MWGVTMVTKPWSQELYLESNYCERAFEGKLLAMIRDEVKLENQIKLQDQLPTPLPFFLQNPADRLMY